MNTSTRQYVICAAANTNERMKQRLEAVQQELETRGLVVAAADVGALINSDPSRGSSLYQLRGYEDACRSPSDFVRFAMRQAFSWKQRLVVEECYAGNAKRSDIPLPGPYMEQFEADWAASEAKLKATPKKESKRTADVFHP